MRPLIAIVLLAVVPAALADALPDPVIIPGGAASSESAPKGDVAEVPQPIRDKGYLLVFHDEFNGKKDTPPDPTKWVEMSPGKWRDLWNVEEACRQDGEGNLQIAVRKNGDRYETGYIGTSGKFQATHGYFECRCRLQKENGFWSAFWLASPTFGKPVDDPVNSGVEIDVMEHLSYNGDVMHHTAHWGGYQEFHKALGIEASVPGMTKCFHTFAVKWDEKGYVFYIDGKETGRWPESIPISNCPEYLILSCESEKWAGDIAKAILPDAFTVDYVRVWQTSAQIKADLQRPANKGKRPDFP